MSTGLTQLIRSLALMVLIKNLGCHNITRFIIQCGEAWNIDALKIRLFSSSLSGPAFSWFTSLSANSIIKWSDLEQQFHNYFFGTNEMKITYLTRLKQRNDETVAGFVQ
jgi:hypothetical protein